MAPIPFTAQQPILPGALSAVWLYIIAILAFLLFGFVAIWSIRSLKARFQSQETAEDRKMTLPTHVDSYTPRDVFLPIWRPEVREAAVDVRCEMQEVPLADATVDEKDAGEKKDSSENASNPPQPTLKRVKLSFFRRTTPPDVEMALKTPFRQSWLSSMVSRLFTPATIKPSETMDLPMQMPHPSWESQLNFQEDVPPPTHDHRQEDTQYPDTNAQGLHAEDVEAIQVEEQIILAEEVIEAIETVVRVEEVEEGIPEDRSCGTLTDILDQVMETYDDSLELEKQIDNSILRTPSLSDTSSDTDGDDDDSSPPHTPALPDVNPISPCKSAPAILALWYTTREPEYQEHTDEGIEVEANQSFILDEHNMDPVEEVIARVTGFTPSKIPPTTPRSQRAFGDALLPVDPVDARIASITGSSVRGNDSEDFDGVDSLIAAVTGYTSPKSDYGWSPEPQLDVIDARIIQVTGRSPTSGSSWTGSPPISPPPRQAPFTPIMLFTPQSPSVAPSTPNPESPVSYWAYQAQPICTKKPLSNCLSDPNSYAIPNGAHLFTPSPRQPPSGKIRITFDPTSTPTRKERARWRTLSPSPCF
ncbi:hypothetical protein BDW22DRAFT_553190 [Trametopsis cervina]|nr:hypothetical protein BDW22DRAFT_553190 [Trametopsis cervina]